MSDLVPHDPYFREWHKNKNSSSNSAESEVVDKPAPEGVAPDAKKVYEQEPISQAERETVEKSIKKEVSDEKDTGAIAGVAAAGAATVAGAAGVAVAAHSADDKKEDEPVKSDEPVTTAQPEPAAAPESTVVPEKEDKSEEKITAFAEESPAPTPAKEEPKEVPVETAQPAKEAPELSEFSKAATPALPKGVANLKDDGPRKPEGISTPAGEHVPIYPGDTPDTPDISGKPNPVTVTVPLETVELADTKDSHIPVLEEGGHQHHIEQAEKAEEAAPKEENSDIQSKDKLPKEAHNAATWTTLPAPEEVPTPLRLSQRSPDTPLAPSLEPSPNASEEQLKQAQSQTEKKEEVAPAAAPADKPKEDKILPPKTPEKAKFQQDQNSHLETPEPATTASLSPGNTSIHSAANLPGGYQQTPEKSKKQEEQEQSSSKSRCLINSAKHHDIILDYLRRKGFTGAEEALKHDLTAQGLPAKSDSHVQSLEELAAASASALKKKEGEETPSGPSKDGVMNELVNIASNGQLGKQTVDRLLLTDPTERERGYRDLDRWVEGSLDVYRPQLRPILFPIFVHTYLDLISLSFQKSARAMLHRHAHSLIPYHGDIIAHLGSLTLPAHVKSDPLAIRWRSQKYIVRLGKAAWNLLLGWLSDALVGGPGGSSTGGTAESKGRALMLKIVNERLRVDVVESATKISQEMIEESTGLISDLTITYPTVPGQRMAIAQSAQSFNNIIGELKLGLPPLDDGLRAEVDHQVAVTDNLNREEGMEIDQQTPAVQPAQSQQQSEQGAQSQSGEANTNQEAAAAGEIRDKLQT
ncbi:hypothetical protein E3Q12_00253 [Wallemia mellicola]|nr:hypothetical protein E3Q12_00253 [Wallemia mellicola]